MQDKTSVAVSKTLGDRVRAFAKAKGTTVSGVVETIVTTMLDSEVPGVHEMEFPTPGKRGRKGKAPADPLREAVGDPDEENDPLDIDPEADEAEASDGDEGDYGEDDFADLEADDE